MSGGKIVARVAASLCVALVVALGPAPAAAQSQPRQGLGDEERSALEKEYEAAFQAVLKDPGNLDKTFRFAELAVAVGDLEGAISALERMLIYNPKLPRVRLELGPDRGSSNGGSSSTCTVPTGGRWL